jgi:mannosyltransferase
MFQHFKNPEPIKLDLLEKANSFILVFIPVVVLILVTILHMGVGYDEDEVFNVTVSQSLSGLFHMFHMYENNMSLYQVLLHFWMKVFGSSEVATRSLSLLFAVLTIPVFFQLERNWLNKTSAFFGALLLAVSQLFVFFSIQERGYSLMVLSVTVSTLLFVKLIQKPEIRTAILYGLSLGIGAYAHYFAVLIIPVHGLTLLLTPKYLSKKYIKLYMVAAVVAAVTVSPLILFPPQNKSQIDWILRPGLRELWYAYSAIFSSGFVIVFLAVSFLIIGLGYWKKPFPYDYFPEKLGLLWALAPVMMIYLFSRFIKPIFVPFYFSWTTPGVALLIVFVINYLGKNNFIKFASLIFLLGIFTWKNTLLFKTKGSGFRDAAGYLNTQIKPGETVMVYPYFWQLDINYFLNEKGSTISEARPVPICDSPFLAGGGGRDPQPSFDLVRQIAQKRGRIYLVCDSPNFVSQINIKQARIWLPTIRSIVGKEHPVHTQMVFGRETQCPVRVIVFE